MGIDYIPYVKCLPRKPEVFAIARLTGLNRHIVVSLLLIIWSYFDDHTEDGVLHGCTIGDLLKLDEDMKPCLIDALCQVGWLSIGSDYIKVHNFALWMGKSAKKRLKDAQDKRNERQSTAHLEANLRHIEEKRILNITSPTPSRRGENFLSSAENNSEIPPSRIPEQESGSSRQKLLEVAARIDAHFRRVVKPQAVSSGTQAIYALLTHAEKPHTEEALCRAAELYREHLSKTGTSVKRVQGSRRFYGSAGGYLAMFSPQALAIAQQVAEVEAAKNAARIEQAAREAARKLGPRPKPAQEQQPQMTQEERAAHWRRLRGLPLPLPGMPKESHRIAPDAIGAIEATFAPTEQPERSEGPKSAQERGM